MGSKNTTSLALFFTVNLLFFTLVTSIIIPELPNIPGIPGIPEVPVPGIPGVPGNPGHSVPCIPGKPGVPTGSLGKCPRDALKLGVCADVLNLVKNVVVGAPPTLPCCALLDGLVNLEAALCLCTAIKANILGLNLNVPVALSLVLNNCGKQLPNGFECT